MSRGVDWLKKLYNHLNKTTKFEQHIEHLRNISVKDGTYKGELDLTKDHVNVDGHISSGFTTLLVDTTTYWALRTHGYSGISTNIHVANLKPAFSGDVISIDAKVYRIDYPLAYIEAELSRKNTDEIVARGQQTMFIKSISD